MALDQGVTYRVAAVNGEPGIVYYWPDGRVAGVQELEIADDVVVAVRAVLNPDKLAHFAAGSTTNTGAAGSRNQAPRP